MATLFNNTEITNAFFNGTELDKIYFNGVLVFEKGGKYLRRIMVGDDLRGKNIYMDSITSKEIQETYDNYGLSIENYYNIIEASDFSIQDIYREHWVGISEYPPSYEIETWEGKFIEYDKDLDKITIINDKITVPNDSNKNYIVTSIDRRKDSSSSPVSNDNHKTYRHFFIEDENIRPLEVGDIILDNTIFYFTFPDNFYTEDASTNRRIVVVQEDDNEIGWQLELIYYDENKVRWNFYKRGTTGGGNIHNTIYDPSGATWKNASKKIASDMVVDSSYYGTIYCRGKVTQVIKENIAYEHILVDTRTLGTSGYKRRIMVGDNLRGKTIYSDFSENFSNELINYYSGSSNDNIFISSVNSDTTTIINKFHDIYGRTPAGDTVRVEFPDEHVFYHLRTNGTVEINNIFSMSSDINYEVGEVVEDDPSYRHIYIEDPKIRPIQVGDKIVEGTKFYFNFPDDLYINLTNYKVDWIIKIENENGDIIGIAASTDEENRTIAARRKKHNVTGVYIGTAFYSHYTPFGTTDGELTVNLSHDIAKNILVDRQDSTLYLLGTVSEINTTYADVYKYILVDITTLG